MATSRPKRMSRKELREQDEVMTRLQQVYEWLRRFRVHLIVGALSVVVLLLVASALSSWIESSRRGVSEAFDQAFAAVIGVVNADGEDAPTPADWTGLTRETFPSEEAKNKAAAERLQKFLAEHDDSALADDASLALASVAYDEGRYDDAAASFAGFLDGGEDEIAPFVVEDLGLTAVQQKKYEDAAKWFGKLVETSNPYFKALGHLHLGDLANPAVPAGAAKDAGKAKAAYEAGLAAMTASERKVDPSERWLKDSLERRLALLDAR